MPKAAHRGGLGWPKIPAPGVPGANPFRSRPALRSSGWYYGPTNTSFPRCSRTQAKFPTLLIGAGKAARADGPERLLMVRQMWFAAVLIYWGRRPLRAPIAVVRGALRESQNPSFRSSLAAALSCPPVRTIRNGSSAVRTGPSCPSFIRLRISTLIGPIPRAMFKLSRAFQLPKRLVGASCHDGRDGPA